MMLERVEYFWGLFDDPEKARSATARSHIVFEAADIPKDVAESFQKEAVGKLGESSVYLELVIPPKLTS